MKPYMSFKQRQSYRAGLITGTWPYLKLMLMQLIKIWIRHATRHFCKHKRPILIEFTGMPTLAGTQHVFCNNCGRYLGLGLGRTILFVRPSIGAYARDLLRSINEHGPIMEIVVKKGCSIGKSENQWKR